MISRFPNRCKHCREKFTTEELARRLRLHISCIDGYAEAQAEKAERARTKKARLDAKVERAEIRRRKDAARTNGQRKAAAQQQINRWVVHVRDKDQPCISCGRFHQGVYHAGHYRSRGSAPHLALDPRNLAKQCAPCNLYLHGNLIGFRAGLIERYGLTHVEALEADNTPRHYSGADLDAIRDEYRARNRCMKEST